MAQEDPKFLIQTSSGRLVDVLNPAPATIVYEDIALALSRERRYAGHTVQGQTWSVGQHALLVASLLRHEDREIAFYGLHHDDEEAFLKDIPSPVKQAIAYLATEPSPLRLMADRMEHAVYSALGVRSPTPEEKRRVKEADLMALGIERKLFMPAFGSADDYRAWAASAGGRIPIGNELAPDDIEAAIALSTVAEEGIYRMLCARHKSMLAALKNEGRLVR